MIQTTRVTVVARECSWQPLRRVLKMPPTTPRNIMQVMASSTFLDLQKHRLSLISAINKHKYHPNVMEYDDARAAADVIASSLQMVADSAAYILIIGRKYGQTPECPTRNPDNVSITELEYNEAIRLNRPILLFIMGDDHPLKARDFEDDLVKRQKLDAFRERAKKNGPSSRVDRVYAVFNSLEEFQDKLGASLADLTRVLGEGIVQSTELEEASRPMQQPDRVLVPKPPEFYAEPAYIGSHTFVGRASQLQELNDWAKVADPTNLLLFEAIGGNGKSMLTWEWLKLHAHKTRADWAGRIWYSFYERGAIMSDFCRRALAYMTEQPLTVFANAKTGELSRSLIAQLHAKPWLIVLDGLERVLVAYHNTYAAELADETADAPIDAISARNPCDTIRDEDNDLLRALVAASPSKILISSRLTPRILINPSGQLIPGSKRVTLPGLRPADGESLLRSCGIDGDSDDIQNYLTANCDNHPLVIGVIAGLINNYLPSRGSFDKWATDVSGGAKLDLASLDLIQRRNHILHSAIHSLSADSKELLTILSLVSESIDFAALKELDPQAPRAPATIADPIPPDPTEKWNSLSERSKKSAQKRYETELLRRSHYEKALQQYTEQCAGAQRRLTATVADLESRGLLQYDRSSERYDLHPVVRSVVIGDIREDDKAKLGEKVVDFFSQRSGTPYFSARSREEVQHGIHIARTWLRMGRLNAAFGLLDGERLLDALIYNLEDYAEALSLIRPFFGDQWARPLEGLTELSAARLRFKAAVAFRHIEDTSMAIEMCNAAIGVFSIEKNWSMLRATLSGLASAYFERNEQNNSMRCDEYALSIAETSKDPFAIFVATNRMFKQYSLSGAWTAADEMLRRRDAIARVIEEGKKNKLGRAAMKVFATERSLDYATFLFRQGRLDNDSLLLAESLSVSSMGGRAAVRGLRRLRGMWHIERREWKEASAAFAEALSMARERSLVDSVAETGLALAKLRIGQLAAPEQEAERLAQLRRPAQRYLAELWRSCGRVEQSKRHALAAYQAAWADGEPHVQRYELTKSLELLERLEVPIPKLSPFKPSKRLSFAWETQLRSTIETMKHNMNLEISTTQH